MGLTAGSTGIHAVDNGLDIKRENENDRVIALAGNPNVGKSTVFNELTGLNQHTGNWPGKTVTNAQGKYHYRDKDFILVDIPGTYSLMAHSAEEEVARDFICFGGADAVVVVCDATCLERNLNLVLQTIEITDKVIVCVNLMDEAEKKHIRIDFERLEKNLGVPVVATSARSGIGLEDLMEKIDAIDSYKASGKIEIQYDSDIEEAIRILREALEERVQGKINVRWAALKLIDADETLVETMEGFLGFSLLEDDEIKEKLAEAKASLEGNGIEKTKFKDMVVSSLVSTAEKACRDAVFFDNVNYNVLDRKIDRILTSKFTGIPIMLLLLALIFWITITGANYPSELLSNVLFSVQDKLYALFASLGMPLMLNEALTMGVFRVLAWVVAVMLPPMAIFFPLFTLLEDLGYLPRVAFNLDKGFKKCCACGKQALTMCFVSFLLPAVFTYGGQSPIIKEMGSEAHR